MFSRSWSSFFNRIPVKIVDQKYNYRLHLIGIAISILLLVALVLLIKERNIGYKLVSYVYKSFSIYTICSLLYLIIMKTTIIFDEFIVLFLLIIFAVISISIFKTVDKYLNSKVN